ncbi:RNA-directed DNA polymerase, eukaryota, Reverse transcriptase zinc-binding domain protein [Artemisia annua]|uniref:RNA-directed DNA polymerase, eukaryota, Reverse transcriptase zinc-binding domain protein n=1 Tax=Artemisia annua TaxID=35608 RepID=A0A2U1NJE9_ARTAN|nr:RNA-directed DNA polymerase, eukaryota, Reverse transcriptase zinc-binding domain protein [Artemisia annua]
MRTLFMFHDSATQGASLCEGDDRICWILYGSICGGLTWMLGCLNPRFMTMRNVAATVLLFETVMVILCWVWKLRCIQTVLNMDRCCHATIMMDATVAVALLIVFAYGAAHDRIANNADNTSNGFPVGKNTYYRPKATTNPSQTAQGVASTSSGPPSIKVDASPSSSNLKSNENINPSHNVNEKTSHHDPMASSSKPTANVSTSNQFDSLAFDEGVQDGGNLDEEEVVNAFDESEGFLDTVTSGWNQNVNACSMYRVVKRLKGLKSSFRMLLHNQGNLHERVDSLRKELDEVQKAIDKDLFNSALREEHAHYLFAFKEATLDEERFLKQKSKVQWLHAGDSNTVKSKCARNRIEVVRDSAIVVHEALSLGLVKLGCCGALVFIDVKQFRLGLVLVLKVLIGFSYCARIMSACLGKVRFLNCDIAEWFLSIFKFSSAEAKWYGVKILGGVIAYAAVYLLNYG